jgi:acyl carrier protein phosphodiesterase
MNRRLPASLGTRDEDPLAVFVRGATVGAFVGAVIAGSTIWRRVRRHAASAPTVSAPTARLARPRHVAPPVVGADPYRP